MLLYMARKGTVRLTRKIKNYASKAKSKTMGQLLKYAVRPPANQPHLFKRLGQKIQMYVSAAGAIAYAGTDSGFAISSMSADSLTGCYQFGWSHSFSLDNVVGYQDFTNLFDRYKIVAVKYKIMFQCNNAQVQGSQVLPILHYVKDEDDVAIPTALSSINQKALCKVKVLGATTMMSYYIKPKISKTIYNSALTSAYSVDKAPYINATYPSAPHYGIKAWVNQVYAVAANNTAITVEPVYYISCRDPQ